MLMKKVYTYLLRTNLSGNGAAFVKLPLHTQLTQYICLANTQTSKSFGKDKGLYNSYVQCNKLQSYFS